MTVARDVKHKTMINLFLEIMKSKYNSY